MRPESEYLGAIFKHSDVHISIQKRITISVLECVKGFPVRGIRKSAGVRKHLGAVADCGNE